MHDPHVLRQDPCLAGGIVTGGTGQPALLVHRHLVGLDPVLPLGLEVAQVAVVLQLPVLGVDVLPQVAAVPGLVVTLDTLQALVHDVVNLHAQQLFSEQVEWEQKTWSMENGKRGVYSMERAGYL